MARSSQGPNPMTNTIDRFISHADVPERHEALVAAPAELTFEVAEHFELESLVIVRTLFRLRAKLLGATSGTNRLKSASAVPLAFCP
jgi:hypothetical protein